MEEHPLLFRPRFLVLTGLILAGVAMRLVPYVVPEGSFLYDYVWGSAPIIAIALFGAIRFESRLAAAVVPLLAMVASDLVLHFTGLAPTGFQSRALIYGTFSIALGLGFLLRQSPSAWRIAGAGLFSCLFFFLVTNFGVWLAADATLPPPHGYPKTAEGLLTAYFHGLPFLRNMVLGNLLFGALLFGWLAQIELFFPAVRRRVAAAEC
jgi:hypothetical protein